MMFRIVVVLTTCATLLGVFAGDVDLEPCKNVFRPKPHMKGRDCCDMGMADMGKMIADEWSEELHKMHDCPRPEPGKPHTCEQAECKLKAMGILVDGKLHSDAIISQHEEFFNDNPDMRGMVDKIIEDCKEENLKDFPEDMCLAQRFSTCFMIEMTLGCTKWKTDDEECKIFADDTKRCNEALRNSKK